MYKIAQSSLENIKSVFGSNTVNHARYEVIEKRIHPLIENFEFAKPFILEDSGTVYWKSKLNLGYKRYSDIKDEGLREQIDKTIYDKIQELEKSLPQGLDTGFLNNIIELPSYDGVYFFIDAEYTIRIVLTEWGFVRDEVDFEKGVLRKIKPASLNSGIVHFKTAENHPGKFVNCNINSISFQSVLQSDENGVLKLNGINRREEIIISSPDGVFEKQSLHFDANDTAIVEVKSELTLTFKVLDGNQNPVSDFEFHFESTWKQLNFKTDTEGLYLVFHPRSTGSFKLSARDQEYLVEPIPTANKTYIVQLEDKVVPLPATDTELNDEEGEIEEQEPDSPITLEFLNRRKKPITQQKVQLFAATGQTIYTTDESGCIQVDKTILGKENTLFLAFKKSDWKKDFTYTDESHLTFIVKSRRFLWWWIPAILIFFLLFSLIPFEINHRYTVLDANTNKPISGAAISEGDTSLYSISVSGNTSNVTNNQGELTVNYGSQSLFDQIFNPIEKNILVEKSGYHSLNAMVPLAFSNNRASKIFLQKFPDPIVIIKEPPAPKEVVLPCSGGEGEEIDGQKRQVLKFNLGKDNVEFLFEYYNDAVPDTIVVSDENGKVLFRCDYATETVDFEHSKILKTSTKLISVEVFGDTNWGIRVNCPD